MSKIAFFDIFLEIAYEKFLIVCMMVEDNSVDHLWCRIWGNLNTTRKEEDKLIFPIFYFQGISELKSLLKSLDSEFKQLIEDTRVMLAMKKGSTIGNMVVKNKQLCSEQTGTNTQQCGVGDVSNAL